MNCWQKLAFKLFATHFVVDEFRTRIFFTINKKGNFTQHKCDLFIEFAFCDQEA